MPVFEFDEPITPVEFVRQQRELNEKIFRLSAKKLFDEQAPVISGEQFDGGDVWCGNED